MLIAACDDEQSARDTYFGDSPVYQRPAPDFWSIPEYASFYWEEIEPESPPVQLQYEYWRYEPEPEMDIEEYDFSGRSSGPPERFVNPD